MTIVDLVQRIMRADGPAGGVLVSFWYVNTDPASGTASVYGAIEWGPKQARRIFHDVNELTHILDLLEKKR